MVCKRRELKDRVVNSDLLEKIEKESSTFTLEELLAKWKVVKEAQLLMKRNVNPQLIVDYMLIKLAAKEG
jgi:DNA polymerase III gamma/tau subunit